MGKVPPPLPPMKGRWTVNGVLNTPCDREKTPLVYSHEPLYTYMDTPYPPHYEFEVKAAGGLGAQLEEERLQRVKNHWSNNVFTKFLRKVLNIKEPS